jgi:hypothetical protein
MLVAVYTQRGKSVHIITRVLMRMHAGLGYLINPATSVRGTRFPRLD